MINENAQRQFDNIVRNLDEDMREIKTLALSALLNVYNVSIDEVCELIYRYYSGFIDNNNLLQYEQLHSPLYKKIYDYVSSAQRIKRSIVNLRDELRDDILDRFDNQEHWDGEIITKFVQDEMGGHKEEDAQTIILEYLETPQFMQEYKR